MSKPRQRKENIHAAASAEDCERMGKRNSWELLEVRDNGSRILSKDCIFSGEQTSFCEDED